MLEKLLKDSWSFFKYHAVAISIIILPIVAPIEVSTALYQYFLSSDGFLLSEQIIPLTISFVAYPIYSVGVIFYIASIISGKTLGTQTLWKLGAKFWLPYMALSILVGLVVMLGFFLLIIPGIIFAIRYAFSEFDLLLNQSKPLDAMRNSWVATKNYTWIIFGGYAVITIFLYVPYYLVTSIFDEASILYSVIYTASNIVFSVISALYTIFAFRVYEFSKLKHNQSLNRDAP